jgi:hypothetical protein
MHGTRLPLVGVVSVLFVAFGLGTGGRAQADFSVNLSGQQTAREVIKGVGSARNLPKHPGQVVEDSIVVGVRFGGWIGGTGPEPDPDDVGPVGWVVPPGEGGHWSIVIDYCCFSTTEPVDPFLTIVGGSWDLGFPGGSRFSGSVESGTVQFPASLEEDLGCGPGVSTVSAVLLFDSGESGGAEACLDDLHAFFNLEEPPFQIPIWGTLHQS